MSQTAQQARLNAQARTNAKGKTSLNLALHHLEVAWLAAVAADMPRTARTIGRLSRDGQELLDRWPVPVRERAS